MFCDFNLGFHIEVNRTTFKTKGGPEPPTHYTKEITSRNHMGTYEMILKVLNTHQTRIQDF